MSEDLILKLILCIPLLISLIYLFYTTCKDISDTLHYTKFKLLIIEMVLRNIRGEQLANSKKSNTSTSKQDAHEWEILQVRLLVEKLMNVELEGMNLINMENIAEILKNKYLKKK